MEFHPELGLLCVGSQQGLNVYDVHSCQLQHSWSVEHNGKVVIVRDSEDNFFALGTDSGIRIYSHKKNTLVHTLASADDGTYRQGMTEWKGKLLAAYSSSNAPNDLFKVWNLTQGVEEASFKVDAKAVYGWDVCENTLVTGTGSLPSTSSFFIKYLSNRLCPLGFQGDLRLRVFDLSQGGCNMVNKFEGHKDPIKHIAIDLASHSIISSAGTQVIIWDITGNNLSPYRL